MACENTNNQLEQLELSDIKMSEENSNHPVEENQTSRRRKVNPIDESGSPSYDPNPKWRDNQSYRNRNHKNQDRNKHNYRVNDRYDNRYYHGDHQTFERRSNKSPKRHYNNDRSRSPQQRSHRLQSPHDYRRDNEIRDNSVHRDSLQSRICRPNYAKLDWRDSNNYRSRDEKYENRNRGNHYRDDRYDNRYHHRGNSNFEARSYNSSRRILKRVRSRTPQQRDDRFQPSRDYNREVKRSRNNSRDSYRNRNYRPHYASDRQSNDNKRYQNDYHHKREEPEKYQRKRFIENPQHSRREFNNHRYGNKRKRCNQDSDAEVRKISNHEKFENREPEQGDQHNSGDGDEQFKSEANNADERYQDGKDDHVMIRRIVNDVHTENDKDLMEGEPSEITTSGKTNKELFGTTDGNLEQEDERFNIEANGADETNYEKKDDHVVMTRRKIEDVHSEDDRELMEGKHSEIATCGKTNKEVFGTNDGDLENLLLLEDESDEEYDIYEGIDIYGEETENCELYN